MNRNDIIRMARKSGFTLLRDESVLQEMLERFAALVAADEREACAKAIEETQQWRGGGWVSTLSPQTKEAIAAAIRARGQA